MHAKALCVASYLVQLIAGAQFRAGQRRTWSLYADSSWKPLQALDNALDAVWSWEEGVLHSVVGSAQAQAQAISSFVANAPAAAPPVPAPAPMPSPAVRAPAPAPAPTGNQSGNRTDTAEGGQQSGCCWAQAQAASHGDVHKIPPPVVDRNPLHTSDDTLSEEAWEAATPKFEDLDCIQRDGIVTMDEAATFGTMNGVPWGEIQPIFQYLDKDHNQNVTRLEYETAHPVSKDMLQDFRAGFADIDLNGDNMISSEEWMAFCHDWVHPHPSIEKCNELMSEADTRAPKGEIDRVEFEVGSRACTSKCTAMLQGRSMEAHQLKKRYALKAVVKRARPPNYRQLLATYIRRWTALRRMREIKLRGAVLAD